MLSSFKSNIQNANNHLKATDNYISPFGIGTNISNAQKIAIVYACVRIKANALSVIPIKLYKKNGLDKHVYLFSRI